MNYSAGAWILEYILEMGNSIPVIDTLSSERVFTSWLGEWRCCIWKKLRLDQHPPSAYNMFLIITWFWINYKLWNSAKQTICFINAISKFYINEYVPFFLHVVQTIITIAWFLNSRTFIQRWIKIYSFDLKLGYCLLF